VCYSLCIIQFFIYPFSYIIFEKTYLRVLILKFTKIFYLYIYFFLRMDKKLFFMDVDKWWTIICHINFVKIYIWKDQLHRPQKPLFLFFSHPHSFFFIFAYTLGSVYSRRVNDSPTCVIFMAPCTHVHHLRC